MQALWGFPMSADVYNALPVPVMDFAPVRDEAGQIIDFTLVWANEAALSPNAMTLERVAGQRLLTFAPHLAGSDGLKQMIKTTEDRESHSLVTGVQHGILYLGKRTKFVTAPSAAGCAAIMLDITDVVADRDTAQRKFKMMEAACDDAVHGIAIANTDHVLVYANPAFSDMLGYEEDELVGKRIDQLAAVSEQPARHVIAEELLTNEVSQYVTDRVYITKTGEEILLSVAVSMIKGADGERLLLGHFRDVRDERKAQHDLRSALVKSEEATRLKSEFLANMSHEIRTPLNGVIGMAQVLSYSNLDSQQAEHLAIIRESSTNLLSLLNDILDLSKVEAGKVEISPVETDVRHKLDRLYKLHEPVAKDKGLAFDLVVHPAVPSRLQLDPVRMRQCVTNLISNAIKFTEAGRIVVAVTSRPVGSDHELTIHVSDSGIGISAEQVKKIFDSFQQADGSTTRSFGGTGLGLTITRKLARLMGGDLSVVSEPGRGSVFTLRFMANTSGAMSHSQDIKNAEREDAAHALNFGEKTVLVVDDNIVNRQVARTFLKAYGFRTVEAVDGIEAVAKAKEHAVDLILMDIHMPRLDGVNAARQIRDSNTHNEAVPIVALTADAMSGDREKYLGLGMNGYVPKPINERELISVVGQVLSLKGKMVANW
jgi:PAS domain S-box-containing protein